MEKSHRPWSMGLFVVYREITKIHLSEKKTNLSVDFTNQLDIIEERKEGEVAIMLIQFNFKNFKSFREEATLDLSAAKMTEFSDRVVAIGSEKILPVAAIYGANASGKSNIYNAFEYMSDYVVNSFKYGDEEEKFEELLRFYLIQYQRMQNLVLKYISFFRGISRREHIIMVFALIKKV